MTPSEEIKNGLRVARVEDAVLATTLPKEGFDNLRELVKSKALLMPGAAVKGAYLYTEKPKKAAIARKAFFLLAKEMYLSGTTVFCVDLQRLAELLADEDISPDYVMLDKVRMVFVADFYEAGAQMPLSPERSSLVRAWVKRMYGAGRGVSFLSDASVSRCSDWWPGAFLGLVESSTVSVAI